MKKYTRLGGKKSLKIEASKHRDIETLSIETLNVEHGIGHRSMNIEFVIQSQMVNSSNAMLIEKCSMLNAQ